MDAVYPANAYRKSFIVFFSAFFLTIMLLFHYDNNYLLIYKYQEELLATSVTNYSTYNASSSNEGFLVYSSKCKIVNLDPFGNDAKKYFKPRKYRNCSDKKLLSYIEKNANSATLQIDKQVVPSYTENTVNCCLSYVTRQVEGKNPDYNILISDCKPFVDSANLTSDFVYVKCFDNKTNELVYENVHATVTVTEEIRNKTNALLSKKSTKPASVLFVGIDSISRLNFIRAMPNTYRYVEENGWLSLKGYNKMDDNTFPNLMAILTGYNQTYAYKICNPKEVGNLDKCRILWYDYRDLGYVTAYGEDDAVINTFNYMKKGFVKPPADYYFRPYVLASEKLNKTYVDTLQYCTGPEQAGERMLSVAKEFAITMRDFPMFGFFWTNTFSHNSINSVTGMDDKVKSFLTDLEHGGVTNTTIVIFLSDHGMRFGDFRYTETGWLEERLPFIYVSFPPWFKETHSLAYENFKNNFNRLTTPYDLYMTLQHLLVLGGLNYTMTPSDACPNCKSLFEEVPKERSCEDAAIEQHWCTCTGYTSKKLPKHVDETLSKFVLNEIHKIVINETECTEYTVNTISTRLSQKLPYTNDSFVLIQIKTNPKAIFETTVRYQGGISEGNYTLSGDISRLDYYDSHSRCVSESYLKKYCYCIEQKTVT